MRKVLTIVAASLLSAAPVLAGINPAAPGLPTASTTSEGAGLTYTGISAVNNRASSMCVDCHSVQPKAGGSHYVNPTSTVGATNSGGSGIDSDGTTAVRDNGAYFKVGLWTANGGLGIAGLSKYGNGTAASVSTDPTVAGVQTTALAAANTMGGYDIICESCHNITNNEAGGNNLLAAQPSNEWQNTSAGVSEICVTCHGYMYTTNAANAAAPANANYSIASGNINYNEVTAGHKANNEWHWVKGVAYPQNHHVMTGDAIHPNKAAARLLWTDNDVVSYIDSPIDNTSSKGTLPQLASWAPLTKPTPATNSLACTNCHSPAHGTDASPAASILRNATYTGNGPTAALGPISRISDRDEWKKINDLAYCTQCHE